MTENDILVDDCDLYKTVSITISLEEYNMVNAFAKETKSNFNQALNDLLSIGLSEVNYYQRILNDFINSVKEALKSNSISNINKGE